jgi:hypothetical protein
VPVIDRADRPADDETRVEIQDVGEIQLTALADHELGGVADPSLIGAVAVNWRSGFVATGRSSERSRCRPAYPDDDISF